MKPSFFLLLLLSLPLLPATVTAAGTPVVVDRVVAVVNGEVITLSDLQRESARIGGSLTERDLLDEMINRKLQLDAAKKTGLDVTDKELDDAVKDIMRKNNLDSPLQFEAALAREGLTPDQYRAELREQITLSRVFNKFVRSGLTVDDAELRAYYEKNLASYTLPEEIRVRQIVITLPTAATQAQVNAARQKAQAAADRARRGEDFSALVRELSEDASASQGGDLGFLPREHVLPEIAAAAKDLTPGQVAGPLRDPAGFRIIRLEDARRPIKPFSDVRDEIANTVMQQKLETTYRAWLQTLRVDATIDYRL